MAEPPLPWTGGCRCDRVRFRIGAPPLMSLACHCTGCQRMTASAFSLTLIVPSAAFEITQGEPVVGGLHGRSPHMFCGWCMSWMFTRPEGMDEIVNVRATLLDDASWVAPFAETFTGEKLPWATTPAAHSFEGFPEMSAYAGLISEYAKSQGR